MNEKPDAEKIDSALQRAAHKAVYGTRAERSGKFIAPKAFISYSHDTPAHMQWVLKLATDLRSIGVDVVLDQWDLALGQDISLFMQRGISEADRVIMVCSSAYVAKSEQALGGVGYERLVVTAEMLRAIDTTKFIPILRSNNHDKKLPSFLGPRLYVDFENDAEYDTNLVQLAREIHGSPAIPKPPLGSSPFSGTPVVPPAPKLNIERRDETFLDKEWYSAEFEKANSGIGKIGLNGHMEVRAGVFHSLTKSQIELLNAVRQSEVRTFGWPIGITLENREEYRPRPYGDGIRAEVSISDTRTSYDYWTLRSNGDFYLLQSFFEDSRKANTIFFDTRIVRVTESLMFLENLYTKLGVPSDARVAIKISHRGLAGRIITSASSRRFLNERETRETESTTVITAVLGKMRDTRVDDVRKVLEPMFMLFDFMQISTSVYEDIVRGFENGQVR